MFIDRLELTIENIQAKKPDCIIITGDVNCKSQKWWSDGIEDKHGSALDELIQSKNLTQLINEPTHSLNNSRSCIDLIITSQPNLFIGYGIHPSLFECCHHEIIHGKLNLTVLPPLAYKRKVWEYHKVDSEELKNKLNSIGWCELFQDMNINMMT